MCKGQMPCQTMACILSSRGLDVCSMRMDFGLQFGWYHCFVEKETNALQYSSYNTCISVRCFTWVRYFINSLTVRILSGWYMYGAFQHYTQPVCKGCYPLWLYFSNLPLKNLLQSREQALRDFSHVMSSLPLGYRIRITNHIFPSK